MSADTSGEQLIDLPGIQGKDYELVIVRRKVVAKYLLKTKDGTIAYYLDPVDESLVMSKRGGFVGRPS